MLHALVPTSEYLRESDIPAQLHLAFPSHTLLHTYHKTHVVIKASLIDFLAAPIQNWEYNRPPDMARCEDIAVYHKAKPVETLFYLAYQPNKGKKGAYVVLDGIHRYTALKMIHHSHPYLDLITPAESYPVLLNIRFNAFDEELMGFFKSINKANPVPDLYLRDAAKDKRDAIEALTAQWMTAYKIHFSTAARPIRPNANRDRFMDLLGCIWDKHRLAQETAPRLGEQLNAMNERVRNEVLVDAEEYSEKVRQKCESTGCWLFVYGMEKLERL